MFIVSGQIELYTEDSAKIYVLEVLPAGSSIGAYSVINSAQYQFSGRAIGALQVLRLDSVALFNATKQSFDINEAIEIATDHILEHEVPACDYFIGDSPASSSNSRPSVRINPFVRRSVDSSSTPGRCQLGEPGKAPSPNALGKAVEKFRNAVRKAKILSKKKERLTMMDVA